MRRLLAAALVPLTLGTAPLHATEGAGPEVEAVKVAMKKGDLDAALAAGEKAVKLDPKSAEAYLWLGRVYGQKAMSASIFSQMSLAKKCRNAFERSVELDGTNVEARWDLTQYYLRAPGIVGGGKDKAEKQAVEIARLDPLRGALVMGAVHEAGKDLVKAEEEFKKAFALNPKEGKAQAALIGFYVGHDRLDDAASACRKAQEADPESQMLHYQAGRVAALSGKDLERGVAELDLFLAKEPPTERPTWADAHWRKGQILAKLGKKAEAKAEQQAALKLNPEHKQAKDELKKL